MLQLAIAAFVFAALQPSTSSAWVTTTARQTDAESTAPSPRQGEEGGEWKTKGSKLVPLEEECAKSGLIEEWFPS